MSDSANNKINLILYIIIAVFWAGSYVAIKLAVNGLPPGFAALLRLVIAVVFLRILFLFMHKPLHIIWSARWRMWLVGLFSLGIPFSLLFSSEQVVSAGLAGILVATVPLWVLLLSLLIPHMRTDICLSKVAGLLVGFAGVVIIFAPLLDFVHEALQFKGAFLVLLTAFSYGIGAILNQRFLQHEAVKKNFYGNVYHQNLSAMVFLLVYSYVAEPWRWSYLHSINSVLASVYLGVFSTAIAWLIYFRLIRDWGAVRASSVTYVVPPLTLGLDYLFFATKPQLSELLGVGVILLGIVLIQRKAWLVASK